MPQSTNFFAALDDSDDESAGGRQTTKTNTSTARSTNNAASNSGIATSAKNDRRKNDRNSTKGGRGEGGRVRPAARDGKRTFDRRSGTGRGREIKKDGGGARNWGSDKADARKAEGTVDENEVVAVDAEDGAGGEGGAAAEEGADDVIEEEVVEPEPEPVTRTYDEYLEDRKNELKDKPQFQPTAKKELVNEFAGVAAKTVVKDEEFLKMGSGKSLRQKPKKSQEKQVVELGFRTGSKPGGGDSRYGDRDRGDRGDRDRGGRGNDRRRDGEGRGRGRGGRGGRGRGRRSGRGGREGGRAPAVDPLDPSSFPSL